MSEKFPKRYNYEKIQKKCIDKWNKEETYKFELTDEDTHNNIFSIDTPPDFTSGNLHMGHILNHAWIDFMARFKRLQGKKVFFPQGFDCHGLPTELKVQNLADIRPSDDRNLFLKTCHEYTEKFIKNMKHQFEDLGYSTDWNYTYKTMDEDYIRLVQLSLLMFHDKGLLYRAKHPVHWCPKCETSLAKQEVGYIDKIGKIWEIKLKIAGRDEKYVTIATTRPEMMESCVAVFIHPNDWRYQDLSAARVEIPFANREVPIFMDHEVDENFGTGVVYCCTFGDENDIMWQKKYDLPVFQVIGHDGRMTSESIFEGKTTKQAQREIIKKLDEMGQLESEKKYENRVIVHTERSSCLSPIEYLPVPQWFINVSKFTKQIKKDGRSLKWYPDLSRRLDDWCDSLTWDWVVSRQRVFGTPIPFWYCSNMECDYIIKPNIEDLPLDPIKVAPPVEKCPKCGSEIVGEKDVCDCWVDSSITPLKISKWKTDEKFFDKIYPITNRPQGYEIIRTWLFYTLFRSKILTGKRPFSEIMVNGMVAGPDGRKMSKSFGNVVGPDEVFEFYGADSVRLWAAMGPLGNDYQFKFNWVHRKNPKQKVGKKIRMYMNRVKKGTLTQKEFDKKYRKEFPVIKANSKFLTKIWNAYRLVWMQEQDIKKNSTDFNFDFNSDSKSLTAIDHFILSELNKSKDQIENFWNKYEWKDGSIAFRSYFKDLVCDSYLEAAKYRYNSEDETLKIDAIKIAHYLFFELLKINSVIMPFITEELYSQIFSEYSGLKSIHHAKWPKTIENLDPKMIKLGKLQLEAISKLRNGKSKAKMALNKLLSEATLFIPEKDYEILRKDIVPVTETLNIENLILEPLDKYIEGKVSDNAINLEDKTLDWRVVIEI